MAGLFPATQTSAQTPSGDDATDLTRASLACGVAYFRATAGTNYLSLPVPPLTTRKFVGYENSEFEDYEIRYKEVTVDQAIYEYVMVKAWVGKDTSTTTRKLGERRVRGKQIGTKKRTIHVRDPNGTIVKTHKRRVGGKAIFKDGTDLYTRNLGAQNAMVLLALIKSGVPEDDPMVRTIANFLEYSYLSVGLPDTTQDVAWMVAAYANLRNKTYAKTRTRLINKLLEGQIQEGPARGLWGPVCINYDTLATLMKEQVTLGEEMARYQALYKKSKSEQDAASIQKITMKISEAKRNLEPVAREGRFLSANARVVGFTTRSHEKLNMAGLPYPSHHITMADLESTAVVLFALREVAECDYLPPQTRTERMAVYARTAFALAAKQKPDGTWDECNIIQANTKVAGLGVDAQPIKPLPITSKTTPRSTVQAFEAMRCIGEIVGMDTLLNPKFKPVVEKGATHTVSLAQSHLKDPSIFGEEVVSPHDLYRSLIGIGRSLDGSKVEREELLNDLIMSLVEGQNVDGSWGKWNPRSKRVGQSYKLNFKLEKVYSSSTIAYYDAAEKAGLKTPQTIGHSYIYNENALAIRTAYSMLFLANSLKTEGVGYLATEEKELIPATLKKAMTRLRASDGAEMFAMRAASLEQKSTTLPPIMYLRGADLSRTERMAGLKEYLDGGAMIICVYSKPDEARLLFGKLKALYPQGTLKPLNGPATFMSDYKGEKSPKVNGFMDQTATIRAVFVSGKTTAPLRSSKKTVEIVKSPPAEAVRLAIRSRQSQFGNSIDEGVDPFEARLQALAKINTPASLPEVDPTEKTADTDSTPTSTPPKSTEKVPQADEVF